MKKRQDLDVKAHNPKFQWQFLSPKYFGTWFSVLAASIFSFTPVLFRYLIAKLLANGAIRIKNKANHRARVNLDMCFPNMSTSEKEKILFSAYVTSISYMMSFASLTLRKAKWLESNVSINGFENLQNLTRNNENVILLVPHTWAIDIPAIFFASKGLPVSAMAKKQKNLVSDWLMHKQRVQYGGKIYDRSVGIKPFIKSIRKGYLGYYLPDEDLGPEHSVFVDFFATKKATISGLGKLSTLAKAKIVPLFVSYNGKTGAYQLDIYPALPFPTNSEHEDARMMNKCIEDYVSQKPEQYMWILRLLKTRPNTNVNPYKQ
ncbi:lauroyl-Kdo(2)-lipid IV(A) myristoyltransferase [Vibrio sp. VB16]|uniref:lauroyl-Kdo(2)-lipid IV(A) myristoyltransferase n=1 Tax=Vibrio sp. VB16 TaxID=2785746 RepID=UPI00189D624A|nr:lauroyl-Kdo(2)-lipid IV(A) myristoyltransferase [Vibrio sp. VB16]UGA54978.1 lauroyl-Kdo(2)-lipid IV(A) myristoyltransferase [Vibrio sp. VB16]